MPLQLDDLAALSRLLDEVLDLEPAAREAWLAGLPPAHAHLRPQLREMLVQESSADNERFLFDGPRLDAITADAQPGDAFGSYRLVCEIARGGMGVVWLAERHDGQVKRPVALKMPLLRVDTAAERERFARERDVLATLDHPRIARLFDAGIAASGQPFIVLEYVDGQPITAWCDARRLGLRARIELFLQVLDAVDHAHKHLVVHRDIKPSNLLVDAQGNPKLLDFGVAKLIDDPELAAERTQLTQQVGCAATPRYAAPEQLENGRISTATDVYALGVLLYELLTGASPYGTPVSLAQWIAAVLRAEPRRPSRVAPEAAASGARGAPPRSLLKKK
jgi:serine/threonine protein kinase